MGKVKLKEYKPIIFNKVLDTKYIPTKIKYRVPDCDLD